MNELVPATAEDSFCLTIQGRILHADLMAAARKIGGVKKLAEYLGLSPHTVSAWINLRSMPNLTEQRCRRRTQRYWPEVERKLCELTGKTAEQLFPGFVRVSGLLESEKRL